VNPKVLFKTQGAGQVDYRSSSKRIKLKRKEHCSATGYKSFPAPNPEQGRKLHRKSDF